MASSEGSRRTPTRRGASRGILLAALAGWVVIIVIGAGQKADRSSWLGVQNVDVVLMIVFGLTMLLGTIALLVLAPFRGRAKELEPKSKSGRPVVLFIAIALLLIWRPDVINNLVEDVQDAQRQESVAAEPASGAGEQREPVAQATDILLLLAIVGIVAAVWAFTRRKNLSIKAIDELDADGQESLAKDIVRAIDDAQVHLASGSDPRSRVLAAYETLERALAERGYPRQTAETASEHLQRVMVRLRVAPEPLVSLGSLYEVARFSQIPISAAHQAKAEAALAQARLDLTSMAVGAPRQRHAD